MTTHRIYVNCAFGRSLGNMIDALSGKAEEERKFIEVQETDDDLTKKDGYDLYDATALAFSGWDLEVDDIDASQSDESQCFGMSSHLMWKEVDLRLRGDREFRAPSIGRLKEALTHVTFTAFCPGDI